MIFFDSARRAEAFLPAAFDFLRDLVSINSFSTNAAGVRAVAARVGEQFDAMGFASECVQNADAALGPHHVASLEPAGAARSIALISHLDTVFPPEEELAQNFHHRREGNRIYGPGSNDIKGGTALIWMTLQLVRDLAPAEFEKTNWFVLHNACEELISDDFAAVCRRILPADALGCLIFEADGGGAGEFSLVSSRKGRAMFRIEAEGRASHAGSQHEAGVNAIVELAKLVGDAAALTDYAQRVTVNVGAIRGGTVVNRVPHEAAAELEMRAFEPEIYERVRAAILDLPRTAGLRPSARAIVRVLDETVPWPRNAGTDGLLEIWKAAAGTLGLPIRWMDRGGLSDGNLLWDAWPTLDGLGPRGENSHCSEHRDDGTKEQEWVDADSFAPKAVLNAHAILRLLDERGRGIPRR